MRLPRGNIFYEEGKERVERRDKVGVSIFLVLIKRTHAIEIRHLSNFLMNFLLMNFMSQVHVYVQHWCHIIFLITDCVIWHQGWDTVCTYFYKYRENWPEDLIIWETLKSYGNRLKYLVQILSQARDCQAASYRLSAPTIIT